MGKNPIIGGMPLIDKRIIDTYIDVFIVFVFDLWCLLEVEFIYIVINKGTIINEYIARYIIAIKGLFGIISLYIHPMWVIDEKAIIDFSFVWFIPMAAPVNALITGMIMLSEFSVLGSIINIMIASGANFCQVDRIKHGIQDSELITGGNHAWHGTIPSLRIREISNKYTVMLLSWLFAFIHMADDIIRSNLDPSAWARKYLSIASDSWNLFDLIMIGIKDSILISKALHDISQLFLEVAITELRRSRVYISNINGERMLSIKI